jgi:hypothetical protein
MLETPKDFNDFFEKFMEGKGKKNVSRWSCLRTMHFVHDVQSQVCILYIFYGELALANNTLIVIILKLMLSKTFETLLPVVSLGSAVLSWW